MTDANDTAPEVPAEAAGRSPESEQPGRRPTGDRDDSGRSQAAVAVRYEQFRTVDPQAVRRFFAGAYAPGWRTVGLTARSAVTHRRCETDLLRVDEVMIQGRAAIEIPGADTVVVIQPRAGSLGVAGIALPSVDFPVLVAHGMTCTLQCNNARFDVVTIATDAVHRVAAEWQAPPTQPTRFLDGRPRSRAAVRAWQRALDYVMAALATPEATQQPLIVATMAPLLAGALLECFPSNRTDQDLAREPALPETLKDAVSFIHRHAAADVGINDVAEAVHLTPRAVQYLFRRQLGTTPTEYMRRIRLTRAHHDLIAGEQANVTVTEIAQRWGFAHTGRFAVLYRQTYGQSPHTTLGQPA